jgi:hypothetical protein
MKQVVKVDRWPRETRGHFYFDCIILPMRKTHTPLAGLVLVAVILAACSPKPDPNLQIRQAVAQTLAAIPTLTKPPLSTPFPSPTPFNLSGLFCEYKFCISHPQDMAFFDISAQQNPGAPSSYSHGILAAYKSNLVIQVMWQISPGTTDPGFLLDLIVEEATDTPRGSTGAKQIGNFSAVYLPLATTVSPLFPYGGAGAWTCGERVFAWKAYTPDTASPEALLNDAVSRFICQ